MLRLVERTRLASPALQLLVLRIRDIGDDKNVSQWLRLVSPRERESWLARRVCHTLAEMNIARWNITRPVQATDRRRFPGETKKLSCAKMISVWTQLRVEKVRHVYIHVESKWPKLLPSFSCWISRIFRKHLNHNITDGVTQGTRSRPAYFKNIYCWYACWALGASRRLWRAAYCFV